MKMADLPGRIVRPMGEMPRQRPKELGFKSALYNDANKLAVGDSMNVPAKRNGIVSRFKKAMPNKVFKQSKTPEGYKITRVS